MIYLHRVGEQYVGPFKSRRDAGRFIGLMKLCGENWADMEFVEKGPADPVAALQTGRGRIQRRTLSLVRTLS